METLKCPIVSLPCGHVLCAVCVVGWKRQSNGKNCAQCRNATTGYIRLFNFSNTNESDEDRTALLTLFPKPAQAVNRAPAPARANAVNRAPAPARANAVNRAPVPAPARTVPAAQAPRFVEGVVYQPPVNELITNEFNCFADFRRYMQSVTSNGQSDRVILLLQRGCIPLSWLSDMEFVYWLLSHQKGLNYFIEHCPSEYWSIEAWSLLASRGGIKKEQLPVPIRQNPQIMSAICEENPAWIKIAENNIRTQLAVSLLRRNQQNWRHIPIDLKTVADVYHAAGRFECGCRVHSPACPACRTRNRVNNIQPVADPDVEFLRMSTIID